MYLKIKNYLNDFLEYDKYTIAVFILLICSFVNQVLSVAAVFICGSYIFFRWKKNGYSVFQKGNKGLYIFTLLSFITAIIYGNIIGIAAALFFICAFQAGFYFHQNVTQKSADTFIDLFIIYSVIAAVYAIFTKIVEFTGGQYDYRVVSTFFNPLYYAFFILFATMFCLLRLTTRKNSAKIYVPLILLNLAAMVMTGGRISLAGIFIGMIIYLFMIKKYKWLISLLIFAAVCGTAIFILSQTRWLSVLRLDNEELWKSFYWRTPYWHHAVDSFLSRPLFGQGFLSLLFHSIQKDVAAGQTFLSAINGIMTNNDLTNLNWQLHAHNITLDFLMNFGIIGSAIFARFLFIKFKDFFIGMGKKLSDPITACVFSIFITVMINGIIDAEIIGLQTSVFTILFIGFLGVRKDV